MFVSKHLEARCLETNEAVSVSKHRGRFETDTGTPLRHARAKAHQPPHAGGRAGARAW